jgi:uncharacterized phage protein (TIGR02218 family)
MIATVVNGQNCWLIPYAPNTKDGAHLEAALPVDAQRGLTGYSSRRPQGGALRYSLSWTAMILAADFAALRNASQAAQNEPILAPVWPHAIRVGIDTATISGGLMVAWTRDWASWAINPASFAGYDFAAPLLYGFYSQAIREASRSDEHVTAEISMDEDSPAGYAFAPIAGLLAADTTFNTAAGWAAPIFPFTPEWSQPPQPGVAVVDVERSAVGQGRQKSSVFFPQTPEQTDQASFYCKTALQAARFIAWWGRRGGVCDAHWVAGSQKVGFLSADLAIGATVLNFTKAIAPLGGNTTIALFDPAGRMELARVQSSTARQIVLAAGLQQAWKAAWTTIAPAMLARHTGDRLAIDYRRADAGWVAAITLNWREVAAEYAPPASETRGTTLGRLPGVAWFFQIDLDYAGAIASTYLTNWESGAVANGHAWTYNACDFDKLIQSIDLEDDNCTFTARWFAGCPWENWLPGQLSARGFFTVYRADVDPAGVFSNFRQVWKGELSTPTPDGPNLSVTVLGANSIFARKAPRQLMSPSCGTYLFKPRCTLLMANWSWNASIVSIAGNVVTIGALARAVGGGNPTGFAAADWFALGVLQWLVGTLPYRANVLTNTALAGGQLALTVDRPPPLAAGAAVSIIPGCDRLGATCRVKFGNYTHFRGFEFIPSVDPSFKIPQQNSSTTKK